MALADQAIAPQNPLKGSHREELSRLYMSDILPRRYAVHTGMIFGTMHRSAQIDIAIWDQLNYPLIPMLDHAIFFAESVHAAVEVKSQWSTKAAIEVWDNCDSVRDISLTEAVQDLADRIEFLERDLQAFRRGEEIQGRIRLGDRIPTVAIFLRGGQNIDEVWFRNFSKERDLDYGWPDLALLLEANTLIEKDVSETSAAGFLAGTAQIAKLIATDYGDDVLAEFTGRFLRILFERSADVGTPTFLQKYVEAEESTPKFEYEYHLQRPPSLSEFVEQLDLELGDSDGQRSSSED